MRTLGAHVPRAAGAASGPGAPQGVPCDRGQMPSSPPDTDLSEASEERHSDEQHSDEQHSEDPHAALRQEIKRMRSEIMALKKSVAKGDKRAKKDVQAQVDGLEAQLATRQAALAADRTAEQDAGAAAFEPEPAADDDGAEPPAPTAVYVEAAKSKAQAKREKRAAATSGRAAALRAARPTGPDHSALEQAQLRPVLAAQALAIHPMEPDGHCLFNAVAHQLGVVLGQPSTFRDMRRAAADYILAHADRYAAFLGEEEGSAGIPSYCEQVRSTSLWGGHLELDALAKALDVTILVVQAEGPALRFGEGRPGKPLQLCFQRHAYSLGEHYDSLVSVAQ